MDVILSLMMLTYVNVGLELRCSMLGPFYGCNMSWFSQVILLQEQYCMLNETHWA